MLDYPCVKFGDCSFSRFGSNMLTDIQTDADERFTPANLIGVSNNNNNNYYYYYFFLNMPIIIIIIIIILNPRIKKYPKVEQKIKDIV